jgi:long-chain acyl-CoA synthetase
MTQLSHLRGKTPIDPTLPRFESLVHMLVAAVDARPEITAVIYEDRRITYAEFGRAVAGLAKQLASLGVRRGERAILMMANSIEMDVALMAVMATGAQVVPVNPFLTPHELTKQLADMDARVVISDNQAADKAANVAREFAFPHTLVLGAGGTTLDAWTRDASLAIDRAALPGLDDLALIIFTGGSTGVPKGVNHTHRGLLAGVYIHVDVWPCKYGEEVFLNVAPMFHIWGLAYATWVPIYAQSTLVMMPRYEPDKVVRALGEHKVTIFAGGPAPIYMGLLASPHFDEVDLSALRYCLSGGAPCPADLHREWNARAKCPLLEGWGMSEGAPFCLNPCGSGKRKLLSVGNPVPETEVQIVDLDQGERLMPLGERGEVRVRGPQLMRDYRNRPDETRIAMRDGWIYTGDIGVIDDEGFLSLVDRKKDMVIVGGFNVYPREVDEVLFKHPKIREAATVGKPDHRLGEVLIAFVVVARGETLTEHEFFAYCKEEMVKYKRPVAVHFVDALPKTGTNKINRIALRALL